MIKEDKISNMKKRIGVVIIIGVIVFIVVSAVIYNQKVRQINQEAQEYVDELIDKEDPYVEIPDQTGLLENTADVIEDELTTVDTTDYNVVIEAIEQRYGLTLEEMGEVKEFDYGTSCIAYFSSGYEFVMEYYYDIGMMRYVWTNSYKFIR